MYPNWEHWRDLKGTCPVCGKPSHVGASMRTGRYYWLHDDYDIREYYREHGKHSSLAEISFDVFQEMTRCAREHGIEPVATIGGAEAASKRVRCIETGKEYRSTFVRHKEKRNMRRMPLGTCIGTDNPDWFELELAGWQQAIKLMEDAVKLGK